MTHRADISDVRRFSRACERAAMGKEGLVKRQRIANAKTIKFDPAAIEIDEALARDLTEAAAYLAQHAQFLEQKRERAA